MFRRLLLIVLCSFVAAPFGRAQATASRAEPVLIKGQLAHPTRILARRSAAAGEGAQAMTLAATGLTVVRTSALVPGLVVLEPEPPMAAAQASTTSVGMHAAASTVPADEALLARIEMLRASGQYDYVEPDYLVFADAVPNDSAFTDGLLWGLRNTGQSGGIAGVDIGAEAAWDITTGSTNVIVAVIDSGIRTTHVDLAAQLWRNPGEIAGNGRDDDGNGYVDDVHGINAITNTGNPADDNGHGTHVAGTIGAAANNGHGLVGVAWQVRLMACKFLDNEGEGSTADAIQAIGYAVSHGARVVNCSWGGTRSSSALRDALAAARGAGVLVVAAAGNESLDTDRHGHYPSGFPLDNIISVAAINRVGTLGYFSNFGSETVDLAAPGVEIHSTDSASDTAYDLGNGTSSAAPFVSGTAALLLAANPSLSIRDLRDRILLTTVTESDLQGRTVTGGRLHAARALTMAPDGTLEVTLTPPAGAVVYAGRPMIVQARVTDLAGVTHAVVTGAIAGLGPIAFRDDGVAPDAHVGDANYTGTFTVPGQTGALTLDVAATAAGKSPGAASVVFQVEAPPVNDHFAARTVIATSDAVIRGTNRGASRETSEPAHAVDPGGSSVWWTWTAPGSGAVTLSTQGSDFDTLLAVYQGSSPDALTEIASNDDVSGTDPWSRISFNVVGGASYQIAVDGAGGATGAYVLDFSAQIGPDNDSFAQAAVIPSTGSVVSGTTLHATREAGEPAHTAEDVPSSGSAWWSWTAPTDGTAVVDARHVGSGVAISAPYVAVYSGDSLESLQRHPGVFLDREALFRGRMTFLAQAGQTYRIALVNPGGDSPGHPAPWGGGAVSLGITLSPGPANDRFDRRSEIVGTRTGASGDNTAATVEPGEPVHILADASWPAGTTLVTAGTSVWWSWTAPEDGVVEIVADAPLILPAVSVYTGDSLAGLVPVARGAKSPFRQAPVTIRFSVSAGVAYAIACDSFGQRGGSFSFTLAFDRPPTNDAFADRIRLEGAAVTVQASNAGATREAGEPVHSTRTLSNASLWWEWTAPASGQAYVASSMGYNVVALYTGSILSQLALVANEEWPGIPNPPTTHLYTFHATAGVRYQIAVDGHSGFAGAFTLDVVLPPPPANDEFAGATVISGADAEVLGDARGATSHPFDPTIDTQSMQSSVWYRWTAPQSGTVRLQSSGDVRGIGIYTGGAANALQRVVESASQTLPPLVFSATAGTVYHLLIGTGTGRDRTFGFSLELVQPPSNDTFAARAVLAADASQLSGTTVGATSEPGEYVLYSGGAMATVWWTWRAPRSGRLVLSNRLSSPYPAIGVFTGNAVTGLTLVGWNERIYLEDANLSTVVVPVVAGVDYHICAQSGVSQTGDFIFDLQLVDPPVNDNFAARSSLVGADVEVSASNLGSLPESGDPVSRRSIWWTWTAPASGRVVVDVQDFPYNPKLAIFTGSALGSLSVVASNQAYSWQQPDTSVIFDAAAGTTYAIGFSGQYERMAPLTLRLRLGAPVDNDLFSNRRSLPAGGGTDRGSNFGATHDMGDAMLQRTVWWTWTAPASGRVSIATRGSDFDTELFVADPGRTLPAPGFIRNDNDPLGGTTSRATFDAVAGTVYNICVGGRNGAMGDIVLELATGQVPDAPGIQASATVVSETGEVQMFAHGEAHDDEAHYVWMRDDQILAGEEGPALSLPIAQRFSAGSYTVTVMTRFGSATSSPVSLAVVPVALAPGARVLNLSTRALCQTGENVLIPGFYIEGTGTTRLLMRAVGPELAAFGVPGALADPELVLRRTSDRAILGSNDDWGTGDAEAIRAAGRAVYAFGLTDGSKSAALLLDLPAGGYTLTASGKGDTTGVSIVELYEVGGSTGSTRLVNLSNRGHVGVGGNIMIPGFVVSEEGPRTFLVRVVGPSLARFGVSGVLADPILEVYKRRPGTAIDDLILTNDTWGENGDAASIRQTASALQAFSLLEGSKDAAFVITLPPGAYTVNARGVGDTTGVALVEVYLVP